ncbi:DUF982 domain-containing protein [Rhizobium sp. CNPSo 3968]|uniref:DUF982 domain-containing protein n=1 Tax=Rhizobium sp. CNPSo 3968 TaxID=3021408 RepID=UPI000DDF3D74|nr:DUF982 domain-containing protein [Rhizobium sp. CNPSo 3968]MDK4722924.1 DUF982 domain-containing protein [Rhizobium sp. CNPSo 3968]
MAQWWSKPVIVETRKTGDRLTTSSAERAAEFMLNEWPTLEDGQAYHAAMKALMAVQQGKIEENEAREAFLAALKEGDIYIFEE